MHDELITLRSPFKVMEDDKMGEGSMANKNEKGEKKSIKVTK